LDRPRIHQFVANDVTEFVENLAEALPRFDRCKSTAVGVEPDVHVEESVGMSSMMYVEWRCRLLFFVTLFEFRTQGHLPSILADQTESGLQRGALLARNDAEKFEALPGSVWTERASIFCV